ncbi:hypothetical protein BDC45DRAFT_536834 [Circinella umbellata]|nr:hypothetical protein BDC45DRAFT_536834 [Circinella umbellata]
MSMRSEIDKACERTINTADDGSHQRLIEEEDTHSELSTRNYKLLIWMDRIKITTRAPSQSVCTGPPRLLVDKSIKISWIIKTKKKCFVSLFAKTATRNSIVMEVQENVQASLATSILEHRQRPQAVIYKSSY